jgi:hypothetical protein
MSSKGAYRERDEEDEEVFERPNLLPRNAEMQARERATQNDDDDNEDNNNVETQERNKTSVYKSDCLEVIKRNPIVSVIVLISILVVITLVIVLPLTLINREEEKTVAPKCPDGQAQPRIDCLPDKNYLQQKGEALESVCRERKCCWSGGGEGPSCSFPYNFGFRNFKTKENAYASNWFELVRLNEPESLAKSDISNLETRIEMHTDDRLRIRVFN